MVGRGRCTPRSRSAVHAHGRFQLRNHHQPDHTLTGRRSAGARSVGLDGIQHHGRLLLRHPDHHVRFPLRRHHQLHDPVERRQASGGHHAVQLQLRQLGPQVLPLRRRQPKLHREFDDGGAGLPDLGDRCRVSGGQCCVRVQHAHRRRAQRCHHLFEDARRRQPEVHSPGHGW